MSDNTVAVCMVQTLVRRLDQMKEPPSLIIVDEAQHSVAGSWRYIRHFWPTSWMLGVTATPERLDGKGLDDIFDTLLEGPSVRWLIDQGFLADFVYYAPPVQADLHDLPVTAGDFDRNEVARRMRTQAVIGDCIAHYRRHMEGRPALCFCATVEHAELVARSFREAGYAAQSIDGRMSQDERGWRLAAIGDRRLDVLTSCDLISEGLDVPEVAGAILLRPTKSRAVFLQQVGRVLRPKADGSKAIILDHVGNWEAFGLPDEPQKWSLKGRQKRGNSETMRCDRCYQVFDRPKAPDAPSILDQVQERCPLSLEERAQGHPDGGCPMLALLAQLPAGGRDLPEEVDGTLVKVTDPWAWLKPSGINPALARGEEYRAMVDLADTPEKLRMIARVRRYHPNWVGHVLRARLATRAGP